MEPTRVITCSTCRVAMKSAPDGVFRYAITPTWAVMLEGVPRWICPSCGNEETGIRGVTALQRAIATEIVRKPARLSGPEFKFLREHMDETTSGLARILGVSPESVSRWEHDKAPVGVVPDRLLRTLVTLHDKGSLDRSELMLIENVNAAPIDLRLRECDGKWSVVEEDDLEEIMLHNSAEFWKMIDKAREGKQYTLEEVKKRCRIK